MEQRERPQVVNITTDIAICSGCGRNILDITNIKFIRNADSGPKFLEELYVCRECGTEFILRYDLFDKEGHIEQKVFSNDPNDPNYNWPDVLTEEQKIIISEHLKDCQICNERQLNELENDVWFADFLHRARRNKCQK